MEEIAPGIHAWSAFSEEKGFDFNGYAVATSSGRIAIDPPEPGDGDWRALDELSPFEAVFVTNRNHSRAAAAFRDRYGATVRVHERDAPKAKVDADGFVSEGELTEGVHAVHVPGKSPGEVAFHVPSARALIVGDLVIGVPPGGLSTYPDAAIEDREELLRSAHRLLELDFDALLVCDGVPFREGGRAKLREFVESAGGPSN